jgi:hypothetical protein
MIITNKMTPELIDELRQEANASRKRYASHLTIDNPIALIHNYLQDNYNIYIKRRTHKGETTYTDTLAFYSQCPDYKLVRRREFINTYGHHFNGLVLTVRLLRQLRSEHVDDIYYIRRVCLAHKANYIIKNIAGCQALIFHDKARYQLFKLKYSEYL